MFVADPRPAGEGRIWSLPLAGGSLTELVPELKDNAPLPSTDYGGLVFVDNALFVRVNGDPRRGVSGSIYAVRLLE